MTTAETTADKGTIRAALDEVFGENRALLAGLTDADLERPTPNPKWKVRQLAGHIAEDDGGALYVGKLLAKGKNAKAPAFVVNLANWWSLRKFKRAHPADLLPVIDAKHRALLGWLDGLPAAALVKGGEISGMGRLTLAQFLVQNASHSREHAADIRAALGRGS